MPVTGKLSRKFYEKFGDDVTNELVERFNAVDATYRSDLRELNDLNWARFEAKLVGEIGRIDTRMATFETRVIKWMFLFWVGTIGTLVALLKL